MKKIIFCLTKYYNIYIIDRAKRKKKTRRCRIMRGNHGTTFQPNNRKRKKKHGFFARVKTNVMTRRRKKGRKVLSH